MQIAPFLQPRAIFHAFKHDRHVDAHLRPFLRPRHHQIQHLTRLLVLMHLERQHGTGLENNRRAGAGADLEGERGGAEEGRVDLLEEGHDLLGVGGEEELPRVGLGPGKDDGRDPADSALLGGDAAAGELPRDGLDRVVGGSGGPEEEDRAAGASPNHCVQRKRKKGFFGWV